MSEPAHIGYHEIAAYYEHLIRTRALRPGVPMDTEKQLAVRHGVTRTTVRRAFQMLVEKGLVLKRQGRGTFVAAAEDVDARSKARVAVTAWSLGHLTDDVAFETMRRHHGHHEFLESVVRGLSDHGRPFRLCYLDDRPETVREVGKQVREGGDLGIIAFDVEYPEPLDVMCEVGVPIVLVDSVRFDHPVDLVEADNLGGMKAVTTHLLRATRGPLAFVGAAVWPDPNTPHGARLEGFRTAHREMGRHVRDGYVLFEQVSGPGGGRAAKRLLELTPHPAGVVCSDDILAQGVLNTVVAAGVRVPEDVAVVGFGDTLYSRSIVPGLTTVAMDFDAMGARAVELIEARLLNPHASPRTVCVPTRLVFRQSAPPLLARDEV